MLLSTVQYKIVTGRVLSLSERTNIQLVASSCSQEQGSSVLQQMAIEKSLRLALLFAAYRILSAVGEDFEAGNSSMLGLSLSPETIIWFISFTK